MWVACAISRGGRDTSIGCCPEHRTGLDVTSLPSMTWCMGSGVRPLRRAELHLVLVICLGGLAQMVAPAPLCAGQGCCWGSRQSRPLGDCNPWYS